MAVRCGGVLTPVTRRAMSATPPFAPLPTAPGMARGHVRATLAQWGLGELADTTEMIASELTANAVNASAAFHAAGSVPVIRLCLITDGETLVVECWDQAPGFPSLRQTSELAETGAAWPSSIPSRAGRGAGSPPKATSANASGLRSRHVACPSQRSCHNPYVTKPPESAAHPHH
jgi:anti-sigma regulatory factor (Ser/Thr protein kinase)